MKNTDKTSYSVSDIIEAKQVMLNHLASLSGGTLIRGCCTQGCCDEDPKLNFAVLPSLTTPTYAKKEVFEAKRVMLNHLASLSGGALIAGCCTQGCCTPDAIAALINVP